MTIVILIPTVLCIIALFRNSVQRAFLNVYLPIFMIVPVYYYWKVPLLPPIDFAEATLFPLGLAMCLKEVRRWQFAPMDLWVAIFIFTSWYADALNPLLANTVPWFDAFWTICLAGVPYMAGKLLLEANGMRTVMVKRMVFCLFVSSIIAVYEYRMGQNPFTMVFYRFFPDEHFAWKTQIRWGFGRVSGPFGQSELAGMMLFFGLILALWLSWNHLWEPKFRRAEWLPMKKSTIIGCTVFIVLLMTQARGPWLGAIVAVAIAMIGRSRNVMKSWMWVTLFFVVVGPAAYLGLKAYTSGPTQSEAQENAQYRQQLLTNYVPVAKAGGPWGWGQDFPRVGSQGSIDDEYLFVALTQGWVGLLAFSVICVESLYYLLYGAFFNPTKRDRYFAYSLAGVMFGLLITIFTVFLGNQPYELFFLLAGWSQAVRVKRVTRPELAFEQVYT